MNERSKRQRAIGISGGVTLLAGVAVGYLANRSPDHDDAKISPTTPSLTREQLQQAYADCKVGYDLELFKVIKTDAVTGVLEYPIKATRNPDIPPEASESGIIYKGLVAEVSGQKGNTHGELRWKNETWEIAEHNLDPANVYTPGSAAYNIFAVAEGNTDPSMTQPELSYRYCGTIAISGDRTLGITRITPVEPAGPADVPLVEIRQIG